MVGHGLVYPTYVEEFATARDEATVEDLIPVALRRWRRREALSQRDAAAVLEIAPAQLGRAESRPGQLKLHNVLELLRASGHDLQVVDVDGTPVLDSLRREELLARGVRGRFAATADVVQLTKEPRWMAERGQSYLQQGPQWTGESRPGQPMSRRPAPVSAVIREGRDQLPSRGNSSIEKTTSTGTPKCRAMRRARCSEGLYSPRSR